MDRNSFLSSILISEQRNIYVKTTKHSRYTDFGTIFMNKIFEILIILFQIFIYF